MDKPTPEELWDLKKKKIEEFLADPRTMGGRDRVWQHIRVQYPSITRRDVAKVLAEDPTHQMHRPLNKRVTTRPIIVKGPGKIAQIDLIDFQKIAGYNGAKRYILTYVDLFSKLCNARSIPNKQQTTVIKALMEILADMPPSWRPSVIQADNGSEFQAGMAAALAKQNIKMIHSQPYQPRSQGAIERLNRTLKSAIFELMTRLDDKRYIDFLPSLIENFNSSIHTSTGYKPLDIMKAMPLSADVIEKIHSRMLRRVKEPTSDKVFSIGDYVRVALTTESAIRKQTFRKKIDANWSPIVYQIYAISAPETAGTQPQFLLFNLQTNRKSTKRYWNYQLQMASEPTEEEQKDDDSVIDDAEEDEDEEEKKEEDAPVPARRSGRAYAPSAAALCNFARD